MSPWARFSFYLSFFLLYIVGGGSAKVSKVICNGNDMASQQACILKKGANSSLSVTFEAGKKWFLGELNVFNAIGFSYETEWWGKEYSHYNTWKESNTKVSATHDSTSDEKWVHQLKMSTSDKNEYIRWK